eukprot:6208699-Pleurochrysis_carterae.AAC.1
MLLWTGYVQMCFKHVETFGGQARSSAGPPSLAAASIPRKIAFEHSLVQLRHPCAARASRRSPRMRSDIGRRANTRQVTRHASLDLAFLSFRLDFNSYYESLSEAREMEKQARATAAKAPAKSLLAIR